MFSVFEKKWKKNKEDIKWKATRKSSATNK